MKKNNPNPKIPDSQTQKADLTSCGLYIPHDKLVDVFRNIVEIEGVDGAYYTFKRMCRFCASVKGWNKAAAKVEAYLISESKKCTLTDSEYKKRLEQDNSVRQLFLNIIGNDVSLFSRLGQLIMENIGVVKQVNQDDDDRGNEIEGSGDSC